MLKSRYARIPDPILALILCAECVSTDRPEVSLAKEELHGQFSCKLTMGLEHTHTHTVYRPLMSKILQEACRTSLFESVVLSIIIKIFRGSSRPRHGVQKFKARESGQLPVVYPKVFSPTIQRSTMPCRLPRLLLLHVPDSITVFPQPSAKTA